MLPWHVRPSGGPAARSPPLGKVRVWPCVPENPGPPGRVSLRSAGHSQGVAFVSSAPRPQATLTTPSPSSFRLYVWHFSSRGRLLPGRGRRCGPAQLVPHPQRAAGPAVPVPAHRQLRGPGLDQHPGPSQVRGRQEARHLGAPGRTWSRSLVPPPGQNYLLAHNGTFGLAKRAGEPRDAVPGQSFSKH